MIQFIKIGPLVYQVVQMGNDHMIGQNSEGKAISLEGQITYHNLMIRVNSDSDQQVRIVGLWHEALHGILHHAGQGGGPEDVIEALGYGIVALIRDNPDLVELTRGGGGG